MKGNNGKGNIEERDLWQTDQDLWDKLNYQYDFKVDVCANSGNSKCEIYFDKFQEVNEVKLTSWMNPPFSKARQMFEHFFIVVDKGVAIYRCDNLETYIWQDVIFKNASWILIPKGRWNYNFFEYTREEIKNKGSRFPSALIGFNVEIPIYIEGTILYINKK